MKTCFKCHQAKPLNGFYKHRAMLDGHLNKCIECTKKDANNHRYKNIERIRAYDRSRGNRRSLEALKKYRSSNPEKYLAHNIVNNAIRDGFLVKKECERCGDKKSQAHHDDYSKPLDIVWLCSQHHHDRHKELRNSQR